jgi:pimeloyl-ACP methyl ester carboxylesterase
VELTVRHEIHYAQSGSVSIAFTTVGDGPIDVVMVPGYVSHLEVGFENPKLRRLADRIGSFARLIMFDRRGTGMSDPVAVAPTLEERMDDVRAVMDAVGSERAALFGFSEGAPMSILFGATYPARTRALVLYGAMARSTWAPDYPWATPKEALLQSAVDLLMPVWGTGDIVEVFAPSEADDAETRAWYGRLQRFAASPAMSGMVMQAFFDTDVRSALPLIQAPTVVIHRRGDRVVSVEAGRWLADHIAGARFVELPGVDHAPYSGDVETLADEIEEFLTGMRAVPTDTLDRVLATVLFVDIVGSTERLAAIGDQRWRELLDKYHASARRQVERFRGREIDTAGDGVFACFDGPARAIGCAHAIREAVRAIGLEVRSGLHTGECVLAGQKLAGIAVHTGARVAAAARPGEVLVSQTVKDLVAGSGIAFDERGAHQLKGVPGEWRLYAAA